jgi:hypothetical protein
MSHNIGRVIGVGTRIGPDSGTPATVPGEWRFDFTPGPAPGGGSPRFVILHFDAMSFPGTSRLEVNVRYGVDRFDAGSGADAWTRPVDPLPGSVRVTYFGSGAIGGVTLLEYGSGEPTQTGTPGDPFGSLTNPDVFLHTNPYVEPTYETRLKCGVFDWQNAACAAAGSLEELTARAVCVIVAAHTHTTGLALSTCSGTLIGPDLVLTAAHCLTDPSDLEVRSGSVCFDYQTTCAGARPAGYAPTFHKIRRIVRRGIADWLILQIDTPAGGLGVVPRQLRSAPVMAGESVFAIHHPHGAVRKLQSRTLAAATVFPVTGFDYAGGSSGSALFDATGQIVGGALSAGPLGSACEAGYTASRTILDELATPPAPPAPFDIMLVMDHSGSMGSLGTSGPGRTKMHEARDAASLFVQLVQNGGGTRMGMVSFSTTATRPPETALGNVNPGKKNQLVGPAPYVTGSIGALAPDQMTSIGDGITAAMESLTPSGNQRAILLMTDGLQNTPPMVETAEGLLGSTRLFAIGFGSDAQLNGALLTRVARDHNGLYTRANNGLELKKFFSLCFGNIFEAGALTDPDRVLKRGEAQAPPMPFDVCEEDRITAIVGWEDPAQALEASLTTPGGVVVTGSSAGVEADRGLTWHFLRVPLPHGPEHAGTWQLTVRRTTAVGIELAAAPGGNVRYFVNVIADGGPTLTALQPLRRVYTGDVINPRVMIRYANGTVPHADVEVTVEAPAASVGQLVATAGLAPPILGADAVDRFHATLQKLASAPGGLQLPTATRTLPLHDDGQHDDGGLEADGVYGNPIADLTRYEGTYTFHARAGIHGPCKATREAFWSLHVELGIDPGRSEVQVLDVSDAGGGNRRGTIRITPRDRYGSLLGPGRSDVFEVSGQTGTSTSGTPVDNGDGSYSVEATWDSREANEPGIVVGQPERPPVTLAPGRGARDGCPRWVCILLTVLLLVGAVVILVLLGS